MFRIGNCVAFVVASHLLAVAAASPQADVSQQAAPLAEEPFDVEQALAQLKSAISGKEESPAVEVFKNIKRYKGVSAARLLRIMEFGFNRSLGVNCTHCHVPGQWELDDKVTKQIARDMSAMVALINNEHLKNVPNLRSTNPSVNCTTCHRGQTRPALELPAPPPANPPQD